MQGSSNKNYRELLTERQGKGFSEYEVMEILRQILPALAEMHSKGKAHGAISLKSLVQIDGSAKLIDVVPDQSNCAKDMLELGLVVLNLLTAKPPRLLKNDDGSWNWDDHCVVSDQLTEIVNRMLAVNPPTRFNSAVEVLTVMGLAAPQPVMYPPQTIQPIATSSQSTPKFPSRRSFLTFLSLSGAAFAGALLWENLKPKSASIAVTPPTSQALTSQALTSQTPTSSPEIPVSTSILGLPLQTTSFQTVSIDRNGKASTSTGQSGYIVEDLGNGINLNMVRIPAGNFMMGMPDAERKIALENLLKYKVPRERAEELLDNSTPQYSVNLSSFLMAPHPVTNGQWRQVMTDPSAKSDAKFRGDKQPVIRVNWHEAREFCQRISKDGRQYRLPTEAEWEYACRAGTTTPFAFGETITPEYVNYKGNRPYYESQGKSEYRQRTVDVDYFKVANGYGLYQMHGNVLEWCLDEWHDKYDRSRKNGNEAWGDLNVNENDNRSRILRGGSWWSDAFYCCSADRDRMFAAIGHYVIGFRVCSSLA